MNALLAVLTSQEFLYALVTLLALFVPPPYKPLVTAFRALVAVFGKGRAPAVEQPLPKPLENPAEVMREAERRFREKGTEGP